MARYCVVYSGVVTEVAEWDGVKPWTPQGTPIQDDEAGIGWTYDGAFHPPPYSDTLQEFTEGMVSRLDGDVRDYVYTRYPNHRQVTLTKLQMDARTAGKTEADAYVQTCWDWMELCFGAYYTAEDQIIAIAQGLGTEAEKRAAIPSVVLGVDYDALTAQDPGVTIRHAMELLYGSSSSSSSG